MMMNRYPNYKGPIEYINKEPYQIVAKFKIVNVKDAALIKKWLNCDTAFKANITGEYIFCNKISEVDWEDIIVKPFI